MAERTVGAYEVKTHLAALLDEVERGRTVTITRNGRPVARLSPLADGDPDDAIARWWTEREHVRPLGMSMKQAVAHGRKR